MKDKYMRDRYFSPKFQEKQFHCIYCGVFAEQRWDQVYAQTRGGSFGSIDILLRSTCGHCLKSCFWYEGRMVVPAEAAVEPPHPDLPEDCCVDYVEARNIFAQSPRASAALLRLCIQKLMPHLGEHGKNINDDIKALVAKGFSVRVQQALDYCRVVGNNAVHPGEININDTPDVAQNLFTMINFIIEDRITRPREIEALYNGLPEESRKAIEKRDSKQDKGM
jgi:hypothetical protein